jgi:hypothetical protein
MRNLKDYQWKRINKVPKEADMSKVLVFNFKGSVFSVSPLKIERKKLYGYNKTVVYDEDGMECETANLDEGASGLIPKGGIGLGILSPEGLWVDRSSLKTVNANGRDAQLVPSSYDSIISLTKKVSAQDLLDYCITGFYKLQASGLANALKSDIYTFEYCYRASYEPTTAFILTSEGNAFMLIGYKAVFEMLSLPEEAVIDEEINEEDDEEIDFSMM